ncbi:MAG: amino acid transporter substrate-binding protein [Peptococcaceae bacterium]|jgi:polar amino acid transport system substrate-binding protein|nr:amino acid transporter substrate-binding protein [Peptococcaceae bacterium]
MLRKSLLVALILLLGLSLIFTGCGKKEEPKPQPQPAPAPAPQPAAENSLERVKKAGKIVAGLDDAYPPMGFRNEKGELVGFDIDMAKEISKRIGVEIVWQPTVWDTVVASLKAKKFDVIISGMNITEKRLAEVNFAGPYGKAGQALVVKANNETIKSLKDVKPGKLGTQSGSTGYEYAKKAGFADDQMKLYKEFPLAFNDLNNGRLDAIIIDAFAVKTYLDKKPGTFKQVGEIMGDEKIGIAVRKEDKELLEALNKAIDEMKKDGTLKKISEKWLGFDITKDI